MTDAIVRRRAFAKKNNLTIGFTAIADFSSFIGQEYLAGIMKAAGAYGVHFINMASAVRHSLFLDTDFLPQYLTKMQFMKKPLIDGLVTWASSLCDFMPNDAIQKLFTSLQPLPMVDIGYLDIPDIPSIRVDNRYSIHLLLQHLVNTHHFTRIAFMGAKPSVPHERRLQFFKKEMENMHIPCPNDSIFMAESLDEKDIALQVEKMLECNSELPQAILTSSDIIAATIIEELEKRHISVPEDIAVTGFNNQLKGISAGCPVTTINLSYFDRGYKAVEFLLDRIQYPNSNAQNRTVKTKLIVRQSCGCFEQSIERALFPGAKKSPPPPSVSNEQEARSYLRESLEDIFPHESSEKKNELVDSILADLSTPMHKSTSQSQILIWFRSLHKERHGYDYEEKITELRQILLVFTQDNLKALRRAEDICNALRVMNAVSTQYQMLAHQSDSFLSNMTNIAISLASAKDEKQLENILRFKLSELHIPGIVLCLSPFMASGLTETSLTLIVPEPPEDIKKSLPFKIREPAVFPKRLLTSGAPLQLTLELLFHNAMYLGYAYLFMGDVSFALYDNVKELVSQTLYNLYTKEGKTKSHTLVITDRDKLKNAINIEENESTRRSKLDTKSVTDYLIDHLDEMTDLDKMSAYFGLSKSHLTRRCRELTGYSAQVLHEQLKIEQAKDLIKSGTMKMHDIAIRLGFSNPNYFSNVFKKVTGMSPVAWAQRNRRN
ncbi:MAG: substrate-binding domain-containing protein [Treponema sp.]|nr:substrate-binding domain-containing protein [Treponema sp.]